MESGDHTLIKLLASNNFKLRKLYEEHLVLEERLSKFEKRSFLTASEEVEIKLLKIRKLRGVDEMMRILASQHDNNTETKVVSDDSQIPLHH